MAPQVVNILLTSFSGLGLPPTLSFTVPKSSTVADLRESISERLPPVHSRLIVTTNRNKQLLGDSLESITSLLASPEDTFIPLRLSAPLCGGKGGFGSQLRAAGGRMASRKKKKRGDEHGSSRNLDGRRLRTVAEAKALAEYLAIKPDMEKKEKEERRQRWENIVEMADKREYEIKNGKGRVDGKWVEAKEEASERTREAILAALKAGEIPDALGAKESDSSAEASGESDGSESEMDVEATSSKPAASKSAPASRTFYGWDEDDDMSDDDAEDEEAQSEDEIPPNTDPEVIEGKGKAVAEEHKDCTVINLASNRNASA